MNAEAAQQSVHKEFGAGQSLEDNRAPSPNKGNPHLVGIIPQEINTDADSLHFGERISDGTIAVATGQSKGIQDSCIHLEC